MRHSGQSHSSALIPYLGCFATVWGLLFLESHLQAGEVASAFALQVFAAALIFGEGRLGTGRWSRAVLMIAFLGSVALLRQGVGLTPGYASLVLLPIFWAAVRQDRVEFSWAILGAALVAWAPILVIGGNRYPASGWRTGAILLMVGASIGVTVLTLVERLGSSERQHRLLAANSTDLIARIGLDGTITYASPACTAMLGYEPEELTGQNMADLLHAEDRAAHDGRQARVGSTSDTSISEARLRHHDGRYLWCEANVRTIRDEAGKITERQAAIRQVEDRKQLQLTIEDQRDMANDMLAFHDGLSQIAILVASGAEPSETFAAVAAHVAHMFDAIYGGVVRFDRVSGVGEIVGGWSLDAGEITGHHIDLAGASAAARVYQTSEPVHVTATDQSVAQDVGLRADAGGVISCPIFVAGTMWGSVGAVFSSDTAVAANALERLGRFAELVAVAIANAQTLHNLAELASTDPVTGLKNHRTFHTLLRAETARAARHGRSLSVALFDIDHFKQVNDTHGHLAGDEALAAVAKRLTAVTRKGEVIARTGGEEFAWLMPETTLDGAYLAAERARRAIESAAFDTVGALTVSVGVCSNRQADSPEKLFSAADQALYSAKRNGRNMTFIHGRPVPETHALNER